MRHGENESGNEGRTPLNMFPTRSLQSAEIGLPRDILFSRFWKLLEEEEAFTQTERNDMKENNWLYFIGF